MKASRNGGHARTRADLPQTPMGPRQSSDTLVGRRSDMTYQRLFDRSRDGILVSDADTGRIVDANPFATRLLGVTHAELLGNQVWEVGRAATDRRRSEFLAIVSHELRNALAPVASALLLLRLTHQTDNPVSERARNILDRQVRHMSHLVDDLQQLARIDLGQMLLRPSLMDLREVVQRSVEAVMAAHSHRKHQVSVAMPAEPIWLDADAIRMEQVVVNLLSNAANYTEDGGSIAVTAAHAQDRAELRVSDSGIGIAPEFLPRVFDLFVRSDTAHQHSPKGLGIGLNIVKRIVDLHGGSVEARSAGPGAGSEFVVSLPLVASAS